MRYLVSLIGSEIDTDETTAAIDQFPTRPGASENWVFACGVANPDNATVVDNRSGDPVVTEGSVLASRAQMSGCWIIDVPDRDAALSFAAEGSLASNRRVELRELLGG